MFHPLPASSPALMHELADVSVVNLARLGHLRIGQGRKVSRAGVVFHLRGPLGSRDGAGHGFKHQDPSQRELCQRSAGGNKLAQFFHGGQTGLEIHTGKGLAHIEAARRDG